MFGPGGRGAAARIGFSMTIGGAVWTISGVFGVTSGVRTISGVNFGVGLGVGVLTSGVRMTGDVSVGSGVGVNVGSGVSFGGRSPVGVGVGGSVNVGSGVRIGGRGPVGVGVGSLMIGGARVGVGPGMRSGMHTPP